MQNSFLSLNEIDRLEIAHSVQCEIDDFSKMNNNNRCLTILSQNIRSVYRNIHDLMLNISQLKCNVDIIILTECRVNSNRFLPQINNYENYYSTNHVNKSDGVVIYTNKNIKTCIKEIILSQASCLQINTENYTILGIYRSPANVNADPFIASLNLHLDTLKSSKNIIITGDLNINIVGKVDEQTQEKKNRLNYLNMLAMQGLLPGHLLPTRKKACLDHFMLKLKDYMTNIKPMIYVLNTTVTDHNMIILKIFNSVNKKRDNKNKTTIDYELAYNYLKKYNKSDLLKYSDPNSLTNHLIHILQDCIKNSTKTYIIPNKNKLIKPWMTPGILRCIRNRNKMQLKLRHDSSNEILKITYKKYRNFCNNLLKKLKRNYDKEQLIKSNNNNPKELWKTINNITNRKNNSSQNLQLLEISSTPHESVNVVNNYFISIGASLAENITSNPPLLDNTYSKPSSQVSSLVLSPTDQHEVYSILVSIKTDSAPGWDNVSSRFLKISHEYMVPVLTHLFNLCLTKGMFPTPLKKSIIVPVHKGGDRDDVSNYRPISILPSLSKILEKLINTRLIGYLETKYILSNSQFGFRVGKSTEDAVVSITSHIIDRVDNGKKCLAVFLDLKKAFDTVSVPILLKRLQDIGIRGMPLTLFTEYLTNRCQQVRLENFISDEADVVYGVPQGSVLGPTLFLAYINELSKLKIKNGHIFSYADDTSIVFDGDSWEDVRNKTENGLIIIASWLNSNLLTLNTNKTNYICFTKYKNTQPSKNFEIKIHTCYKLDKRNCHCDTVNRIEQTKYLGIMIDQRLSWIPHIDLVMSRMRKLMYTFKTLRQIAPQNLLNQVYISLAQSVLTYCIPIWGGAIKSKLIDLEIAQRALLKVMYFKPFQYSTKSLYSVCDLLSVRKLYILQGVLRLHKTLPYDAKKANRRRNDIVTPSVVVRTSFAGRQFKKQINYVYNIINKELKIYPMTRYHCKKTLMAWLKTKSYDDIESLLQISG